MTKPILFVRIPVTKVTHMMATALMNQWKDNIGKQYYILLLTSDMIDDIEIKVMSQEKVVDQLTEDEIKEMRKFFKDEEKKMQKVLTNHNKGRK